MKVFQDTGNLALCYLADGTLVADCPLLFYFEPENENDSEEHGKLCAEGLALGFSVWMVPWNYRRQSFVGNKLLTHNVPMLCVGAYAQDIPKLKDWICKILTKAKA